MASSAYGHHPQGSHSQGHRGPSIPNIPPGTFPPGTPITVGQHKCTIERYLSEGGFAHVYLVKLTHAVHGSDVAVLKRVAVPDKEALGSMRTEVDTMKRLKGHRHIVTYIDSHASHLKGGGYEVFLLMEFCSGGGLIDFMNTRLQHRLTEPEVLKIFSDVTLGVAAMHYLEPPLLHRDLKVENVLIAISGGYKVCDFGSCAVVQPAGQTPAECRLLEEDIQKHTTLQYRSPEMVDVYRRLPIDEKSDIWALGVLLYKLCYYTTPFEEQGTLAILNAKYTFPSHPSFSERLKNLIASMLREQPHQRPNIYQIVREVHYLRGREVPINDIYTDRPNQNEMSLKPLPVQSPPSVVAYQAPPPVQVEAPPVPDITPMRRGRPQPDTSVPHSAATSRNRAAGPSPNVRPTNIDPFAALDKKSAQDEISNRFPSVEQFSLLHDSGNKFQFGDGISPQDQTFDSRVEKLVEDAFSTSASSPPKPAPPPRPSGEFLRQPETVSRGVTGSSGYVRPVVLYEPQPNRPVMVSTGTMTTPSPSESPPQRENIPQNQTLTAVPPTSSNNRITETYVTISRHHTQQPTQQQQHSRPSLLDVGRASTYMSRQPSSSRPSLELLRTPLQPDLLDLNQPIRSKSANSKPRPHSVYVESNLEFLRDLDSPSSQGTSTGGFPPMGGLRMQNSGHSISSVRSDRIDSDVGFLRSLETSESDGYLIHKPERRVSGAGFVAKHVKRASMPSISLPKPGVKNMLGGKFGDAFRRFERGAAGSAGDRARSPSPDMDLSIMSEMSDEWQVSTQDIPPEMKREMEKRQTSMEEKRVAAAAAEYKRQLATRGDVEPGPSRQSRNRANSIQKRVQALLNETKDPPPKTAEGYGRYTVPVEITQLLPPPPPPPLSSSSAVLNGDTRSPVKSESYRITQNSAGYRPSTPVETRGTPAQTVRPGSSGIGSRTTRKPLPPGPTPPTLQSIRPPPPPKPNKLRTGGSNAMSARTSLESVRDVGTVPTTTTADEDWERSFAKRYPSLSGLETVETVVATRKS